MKTNIVCCPSLMVLLKGLHDSLLLNKQLNLQSHLTLIAFRLCCVNHESYLKMSYYVLHTVYTFKITRVNKPSNVK